MAAPSEITLKDLTGQWINNKSLSDDVDAVLALQGVGWWTRKAISFATVTLHVKQYTTDNITHIDIDQTATGGIKGTTENRVLEWVESEHEDHVFGKVKAKSRWITLDMVDDAFLKEDWEEAAPSGPNGEPHIESFAKNEENGWDARQVWGFATIEGKRYYVRRIVVTKGTEALKIRMVYNWNGKE